jgi:hypothetical protein
VPASPFSCSFMPRTLRSGDGGVTLVAMRVVVADPQGARALSRADRVFRARPAWQGRCSYSQCRAPYDFSGTRWGHSANYCSAECNHDADLERKRNSYREQKERERQPLECGWCGKHFTPRRTTAEFCSTKCRVYAWRGVEPPGEPAVNPS